MDRLRIDKIGHYYESYDGELFELLYRRERHCEVIMLHCKSEIIYEFDYYGITGNKSNSYPHNIRRYIGDRFKEPFYYESTFNGFTILNGLTSIIFEDNVFKNINTDMKFRLTIEEIFENKD